MSSVSKEVVKRQVDALGFVTFSKLTVSDQLKHLPSVLDEGEQIVALAKEIIRGAILDEDTGLFVVTDCSVVFLKKKLLGGARVEEFPAESISGVSYNPILRSGFLKLNIRGQKSKFDIGSGKDAKAVVNAISDLSKNATSRPQSAGASVDVVSQLERPAKLKEDSQLTEEEFEALKARILS